MAPLTRQETGEGTAQAWYAAKGALGERLLGEGHVEQAIDVFETMLGRIGGAPSYGRAVVLGRLGRCHVMGGRPDLAVRSIREAIDILGGLAPTDGVKALRGELRSELGEALRAGGHFGDARKAYEAALKIAEERKDLRAQGVELGRLGSLALAEQKFDDALSRQRAALHLFQRIDEPGLEAASWHQLGKVHHEQGHWDDAERHYREAARICEVSGRLDAAVDTWIRLAAIAREAGASETAEGWYLRALDVLQGPTGSPGRLGRCLAEMADLLRAEPGRLADARRRIEEALGAFQSVNPTAPDVWRCYGILAGIIDKESQSTADVERRAALDNRARELRTLQAHAPVLVGALARLGGASAHGRAVLLGQVGRCLHVGGRPDLGVACHRDAIATAATLAPSETVKSLRGVLHADLGDMYRGLSQDADATHAYETALTIAEELHDVRGQVHALQRLGRAPREEPPRRDSPGFEITIEDDLTTDFVFGADLLVDGPRERRVVRWAAEAEPLADGVRPAMLPGARTWMDGDRAVWFALPQGEPFVERYPECTSVRRTRRAVIVSGGLDVLWLLLREADGTRSVAGIRSGMPAEEWAVAGRLLSALSAAGVIDVSGRPLGRFLHLATKKGVLPAGGLEGDAVLQLAADGSYRAYPDAPRIAVSDSVPDRLRVFHALTRARRSRRDYGGVAVSREELDALLHTACGLTGEMAWAGRSVKLRAYPSSGALYAVEIYPVVFRVEGLKPAVYHYRAPENALEIVRPEIDPARLVGASLPVEREMVAGAAALVCLTGCFQRHERKYGEGGYRMLVAEAGHVSQNLILTATALGLSARPFGGVFDDLLNDDLGLDNAQEQFLLAVLVGRGPESSPLSSQARA